MPSVPQNQVLQSRLAIQEQAGRESMEAARHSAQNFLEQLYRNQHEVSAANRLRHRPSCASRSGTMPLRCLCLRVTSALTLQALKAAQMESRLLQQERMAQQSESRAAHMENRIVELQRMLEGAQGQISFTPLTLFTHWVRGAGVIMLAVLPRHIAPMGPTPSSNPLWSLLKPCMPCAL